MFGLWGLYSIISTIISGIVVGLIASFIMDEDNGGFVKYALIGIVGSALGSFIASAAGIYAYGKIASLAVNLAGSCLLIWILRKIR